MNPEPQTQPPSHLSKINYLALETLEASLEDEPTCTAYHQAILQNQHLFDRKTVLHLTNGCFCLYSIFAAQAGASKVYCVINGHNEQDKKNIEMMKEIIKENGFEDVIDVCSFRYFNFQVDVLIGQPMGFNLFYDSMLDRMIEVRDLYLKKKGLIFPDVIKFKACFIRDEHFADKKIEFWNEVYGIPMSSMKKWISQEPVIRRVDPALIVSEITKFIQFNIYKVSYEQIDKLKTNFKIKTNQKQQANGLTVWFQAEFNEGNQKVEIKASPYCTKTRWTHMTLYKNGLWNLNEGEDKQISLRRKKEHLQGYSTLKLIIDKEEITYAFS